MNNELVQLSQKFPVALPAFKKGFRINYQDAY
jgi:hypothetical protein